MHAIPRGLYGMIDLPPDASTEAAASLANALLAAGTQILQLRMKDAPARAQLAILAALRPITQASPGTLLIMNDRLDVALAAGVDGVHLGQEDLPLPAARRLAPPGFLIGLSTHNEAQAQEAISSGADYIALGPIYPTTSKSNPDPVVGIQRLGALCRACSTPVVAIGGITLSRVPEVVAAGAHAAALIAAVNRAPDVSAAARQVRLAFAA